MPTGKRRLGSPTLAPGSTDKRVTLTIPEDCRMLGVFKSDQDISIALGNETDGVKVLRLDRVALGHLAGLALELLAVPHAKEAVEPPVIVDPGPATIPDITSGEDSEFITQLRRLNYLLGPYAHQLLHPDADTKPFCFADEVALSAMTTSLGHGIRELAFRRYNEDEWDHHPGSTGNEAQG